MSNWIVGIIALTLSLLLGYFIATYTRGHIEGFKASIDAYKSDPEYKKQVRLLVDRFDANSGRRRGIDNMLSTVQGSMPEDEQCFINFNVLAARMSGFIGPSMNGYFDADNSILYAVKAGCRAFVYEIDYIETCVGKGDVYDYYPTLVMRDQQGKLISEPKSILPKCNSDAHSNILQVSKVLRQAAFSDMIQNKNDPLIVILYIMRLPPRSSTGPQNQITFMSRIAKGLAPLLDRRTENIAAGGTFARQQQEGLLLTNHIREYEGRVLFFCNTDTSIFRNDDIRKRSIPTNEDLDYIVNLRLTYKQNCLGATAGAANGTFGGLEAVNSMLAVPSGQIANTVEENKMRWTMSMKQNTVEPVDQRDYDRLTQELGVACVPIHIWDSANEYMFADNRFKVWSFVPKPKELRYRRPPVAVPAKQAPQANANGGMLRAPVV
jgi:hypothetical protein